jgi:uncharacterized BrkB/YihY/UPF0761 family membrane protein
MDWSAALTFYAGISLIPALLIVIAALGLLGDSTLDELTRNLMARDDGPLQMALTAATILAISGTALAVVITGPLAREVAALVGLEQVVADVWDLAKWPLVVAFVLTIFAVLYWAAPDVRERGFQCITPGGAVATSAWVVGRSHTRSTSRASPTTTSSTAVSAP